MKFTEQSPKPWLVAWLLVALGLRITAAVVVENIVQQTPGRVCLIEGDADGYWQLGKAIANGSDYSLYDPPRRILRMPGLPVLLAFSQWLFGERMLPARVLLATISALGCWGVYLLGTELADHQTGLLACAAAAVSPPLVIFSPLFLTEATFATAMVFSLWLVVWICRQRLQTNPDTSTREGNPRVARIGVVSLFAGGSIALATYLKPTWLPVTAAAMLAVLCVGFRGKRPQTALLGSLAAICILTGFIIAMLPWTYRNFVVTGHWIPTTLWVGPSLYDGLNPGATGDSDMRFFDSENLMARMSEYEMDQEYRQRAWAFARQHPRRVVELAAIKACRYWSPLPNAQQFQQPSVRWGLFAVTMPLYGFTLLGAWTRRRDLLFLAVTTGPALFFGMVHLLFVGSIRYRLPAELPMWIAGAIGFQVFIAQFRTRTVGGQGS